MFKKTKYASKRKGGGMAGMKKTNMLLKGVC